MALARKLQVMVWNWLEYRMNLQHIGQAWTILDHPGPFGPIWTYLDHRECILDPLSARTAVEHLCPCRDVCLLWPQGAVKKKLWRFLFDEPIVLMLLAVTGMETVRLSVRFCLLFTSVLL